VLHRNDLRTSPGARSEGRLVDAARRKSLAFSVTDVSPRGEYFLGPRQAGDGGRKTTRRDREQRDMADLVHRRSRIKGPPDVGSHRTLGVGADCDAEMHEPLGAFIKWPCFGTGFP
jgi:hypothetical protein